MKKIMTLTLSALFVFTACGDKDIYQPTTPPEAKTFELFDKVSISSNLPDGTRCLLFTTYPYNEEGDLVHKPVMVAYAPFNKSIRIPKAVEKLYTYANGAVVEHEVGNVNIAGTTVQTRTANFVPAEEGTSVNAGDVEWVEMSDAFISQIYSYYPEAQKNAEGEELETCTDLYAPKGEKETKKDENGNDVIVEWGNTKVWVTYVGAGGTSFKGNLWYYTYQIDENGTPVTPLTEIDANKVQVFQDAHDLHSTRPDDTTGKRVYLGEFEPGTRIGFIYQGNFTQKYSTPHYNKEAYGLENTCGIIRTWEYEGKQFATVGMENKLEGEPACDHDFNDMVCLIEATPLCVENVIEPPTPDPAVINWQGYWLFEDNYPKEGDYDFNDLIVKYAITEWDNAPTSIDLMVMATGAMYDNSFGVNDEIYIRNLSGFVNVKEGQAPVQLEVKQIRVPRAAEYIPILNNGTVTFGLNTYYDKDEDFPCVLEVPVVNGSQLRWCLEGIRIDDAYPRYKDWVDSKCTTNVDWYTDQPVEGTTWN